MSFAFIKKNTFMIAYYRSRKQWDRRSLDAFCAFFLFPLVEYLISGNTHEYCCLFPVHPTKSKINIHIWRSQKFIEDIVAFRL